MVNLQISKYLAALALPLFVLLAVIFPGLALVLLGVMARSVLSEKIGSQVFAIAIVGFLFVFNATKHIDGDWTWYVADYLKFSQIGLLEYINSGELSIRATEPIYYTFSNVLSGLSGGNVFVLTLGVSLAVYLTYYVALERLLRLYDLPRSAIAICIIFALLAGLTFTQSTHLVRQYIAGSILFFFFVFIVEGRIKAASVLFVLGILVHNTFIIPATWLAFCAYLWNIPSVKRHYFWGLIIMLLLGYSLGATISSQIVDSSFINSAMLDDGSISVAVYVMDGLLFLATLIGLIYLGGRQARFYTKGSAIVALFLAAMAGMLIGGRELNLFILRLYFYIEWFRVIGVITIVWFLVYRAKRAGLVFFIIPLTFLALGMRIEQSPWDYGGGLYDHLTGSISWWLVQLTTNIDSY